MPHSIATAQLSLMWTRPLVELPTLDPATIPMPCLVSEAHYGDVLQARPRQRLTTPWLDSHQLFWKFFLDFEPARVPVKHAWQHMVPLRVKLDAPAVKLADVRLFAEGFFYRHGIAFVLTAKVTRSAKANVVDTAISFRRDKVFVDAGGGLLSVDDVAARQLADLQSSAITTRPSMGKLAPEPFSVATIVECEATAAGRPVKDQDDTHRVIDALANLAQPWAKLDLPTLGEKQLQTKQAPPNHVLYARDRARVVWFPTYAVPNPDRMTRLSCYHRNLMFASMHTEALAKYASAASAIAKLEPAQTDCMRFSAIMLGRLYHGKRSYRTSSVKAQLDHDQRKDEVNRARTRCGLAPLPFA